MPTLARFGRLLVQLELALNFVRIGNHVVKRVKFILLSEGFRVGLFEERHHITITPGCP
jgi:hypothetical protein